MAIRRSSCSHATSENQNEKNPRGVQEREMGGEAEGGHVMGTSGGFFSSSLFRMREKRG